MKVVSTLLKGQQSKLQLGRISCSELSNYHANYHEG